MATIDTARYFHLRSMGAVAPGDKADLVLVDDLRQLTIHAVIEDGRVVARDGELVDPIERTLHDTPGALGQFRMPKLSVAALWVPARPGGWAA
jgi:adenine deaminase